LQVQSHSEAMLVHDELMKTLESELKLTKEFAEMIPSKVGFLEEASQQEDSKETEEGDLAKLQADVVRCEAAVSEAKIVLKAAKAAIANLESELATLAARIPQAEAQKKNAAASRDFKAASKASKEIKDATSRLKECHEELVGEATSRKAAAEEEAARLDAELIKTRKVADEKEELSYRRKMAALAKKIEHLVETKIELCGDATSSDNSVRGVGSMVLEGQIKSLRTEGETLGEKYGGWKELMGEGGDSTEAERKEEDTATAPVDDGLSSRERIVKVRDLLQRIQDAEEALESAAAEENFDQAAELHEVFQTLQSELENINLSEEETEIAMGDEELPEEPAAEEPPTVEKPETEEGEEASPAEPEKEQGEEASPAEPETEQGEEASPAEPEIEEGEEASPAEPETEEGEETSPAEEASPAEEEPAVLNEPEAEKEVAEEEDVDVEENGDAQPEVIESKPSEDAETTDEEKPVAPPSARNY
jgi:hypothetical protein